MTRIMIDPVTRIEGHLRIEAQVENAKVTDAWSTSIMFRGMELVLQGQDPRDAWTFAQRICGGCATSHALCSVRAVEDALHIQIPENARLVRNILAAIQHIQDHVIHFYHLHALDWVDIASALNADPTRTARLARSISDWPLSRADYFGAVKDRVAAFVQSRRTDMLDNGYGGHPAYRLPPEANLLVVAHYLQALDWQRDVSRIQPLCGTRNPRLQTYRVGGMACPVDFDDPAALNAPRLVQARHLFTNARDFVEQVYIHDVLTVASSYKEWATYGGGPGNYMACGDFPLAANAGNDNLFLPPGMILGKDLSKVQPMDRTMLTGHIADSWFEAGHEDSWLNSPRYNGEPMEVGPLARMLIAYTSNHGRVGFWVDTALARLELGAEALSSTLGRMVARGIEAVVLAERVTNWLDELAAHLGRGDRHVHNTERWDPTTWPQEAMGFGWVEAPRGALSHGVHIKEGTIAHYQCLVPGAWNASPRSTGGQRSPCAAALLGTPVADPERPIEILRTVHSFDPCMACAVHVTDPGRHEISRVRGGRTREYQAENGEQRGG
jgi:Ni,Fe-hydrogenase I large subunit